jgi:hypothetical protein
VVTATVIVTPAERKLIVLVLKQAPYAATVAAMVSLEHYENSAELDPLVTDKYIGKPLPAGLQVGTAGLS